jgi:hypothetical protein
MFLSEKEIIFFVLVFCVIFVVGQSAVVYISSELNLFFSLLGVLLLVLIYKFGNIIKCQSDGFHFEVSPFKKCRGFPYMQSGNPELLEECGKLFSIPLGQKMKSCDGMYVGRPYSLDDYNPYDITPESNDQWKNERCNAETFVEDNNAIRNYPSIGIF